MVPARDKRQVISMFVGSYIHVNNCAYENKIDANFSRKHKYSVGSKKKEQRRSHQIEIIHTCRKILV